MAFLKQKIRKQCVICGNWFDANMSNQVCCSDECKYTKIKRTATEFSKQMREKKHAEELSKPRACGFCGKEFFATRPKVYCSDYCYKQAANARKRKEIKTEDFGIDDYDYDGFFRETRKPSKSLSEVCREAREHGMSYGEYVVYLEGRA